MICYNSRTAGISLLVEDSTDCFFFSYLPEISPLVRKVNQMLGENPVVIKPIAVITPPVNTTHLQEKRLHSRLATGPVKTKESDVTVSSSDHKSSHSRARVT